jgi:uncharacterized protein (UPF0548 family)
VFRLGRPAPAALEAVAHSGAGRAVTYGPVGASLGAALPPGYRHDRRQVDVASFALAADGLRRWQAHAGAGVSVAPRDAPTPGATVAVALPLGPVSAIAPCRVVAVVDSPDRYGFAYGSLPGHPEEGEESFVVERDSAGRVIFRVVAFSRPAGWLVRVGGPVSRLVQVRTTIAYLDGLRRWADGSG